MISHVRWWMGHGYGGGGECVENKDMGGQPGS